MIDTTTPMDVWLRFDMNDYEETLNGDDPEVEAEANTFRNEDGTYRVEWYLNAVGQVTTVEFPTYEEAVEWYAREGFQDFSS